MGEVRQGKRTECSPPMEIGLICESDYTSITIISYSQELPMIVPLERKIFFLFFIFFA